MTLRVAPLTEELFAGWSSLFEACGSGCFCRYWHFDGTKNDWLARLAIAPRANEDEQRARLSEHHRSADGLVALDGDATVGWMKLVPRADVPKLRRLPVYRALDLGADEGVLSIACLLVHPSHRRRGVASALLSAAVQEARSRGAHAVEAYPHVRSEALRDEELWMGPARLFDRRGFVRAQGGNDAYPVLRLDLGQRVPRG